MNAARIVNCLNHTVIKISVLKGILKTKWKETTIFLCKWVWDFNLRNKDFCLKWHFNSHKRGKHKFELGTRSEPKTGKCGKISQKGGGSDQIPLFYVRLPKNFCMPKSSRGAKTCFTKVGSWYLIILNNYTCFLFGEIAKTGVAEGRFPFGKPSKPPVTEKVR